MPKTFVKICCPKYDDAFSRLYFYFCQNGDKPDGVEACKITTFGNDQCSFVLEFSESYEGNIWAAFPTGIEYATFVTEISVQHGEEFDDRACITVYKKRLFGEELLLNKAIEFARSKYTALYSLQPQQAQGRTTVQLRIYHPEETTHYNIEQILEQLASKSALTIFYERYDNETPPYTEVHCQGLMSKDDLLAAFGKDYSGGGLLQLGKQTFMIQILGSGKFIIGNLALAVLHFWKKKAVTTPLPSVKWRLLRLMHFNQPLLQMTAQPNQAFSPGTLALQPCLQVLGQVD
ncbi:MAG: hypothetical protein CMF50_09115 [Legionellales bacterium]|nr:hypothetical protein [Legionellales bacterium]|tara:strand:- start:2299 stop:3168 length:870 start_codon:yes stop_codon:yes gene_type:complete